MIQSETIIPFWQNPYLPDCLPVSVCWIARDGNQGLWHTGHVLCRWATSPVLIELSDCPNSTQLLTVWDIKGVLLQNFQDNKQVRLRKLAHIIKLSIVLQYLSSQTLQRHFKKPHGSSI